jgi:DNA invertase Pin-like site-specific DNA recombinase
MVSGGSATRFDSILQSLADDRPTHFVVADLSRWTRDEPKRYWVIRALVEDQGAHIYSVNQDYLNDTTMPFSATLTTAHVEMAHQERETLRRKTREGMARARENGKHWGRIFGWTMAGGQWTQDEPRIRYLYQSVIDGVPYTEIARKLGLPWYTSVHKYIRADAQREVVGDQMWLRANEQVSRRQRAPRAGVKESSIYRALLIGPCGERLSQMPNNWGNYRCQKARPHDSTFGSVSVVRHVNGVVQGILDGMRMPHTTYEALRIASLPPPEPPAPDPVAIREQIERLTLQWSKGRLSERTYERQVQELEALLALEPAQVPQRTPEERVEIIRSLRQIDLMDRNAETGNEWNRRLRDIFYPIHIGWDKKPVEIRVREEYLAWFVLDYEAAMGDPPSLAERGA